MNDALLALHARLPSAGPIRAGAFRARCPVHAGKSQSLSVRQGDSGLLLHCFAGCATEVVLTALGLTWRDLRPHDAVAPVLRVSRRAREAPPPRPAPSATTADRRRLARRLWLQAVDLGGTLAERYLLARGVLPLPPGADLRFHPDARVFGLHGPALVGRVSEATDARHGIGVHVTLLHEPDGRPARLGRRYVGAKAGGVVRLCPDEDVREQRALGVGEGIETTLALHALVRVPVWACLDAGNLAALPALAGIEVLHIAVDRDESGAGQRAALAVGRRWTEAGRRVHLHVPEEMGADLADVAREVVA